MESVTPSLDTSVQNDVLMRTYRSPRCTAVSSTGKLCHKPRMRINPKEMPAVYTQKCFSHGGSKEKYEFLLKTNTAVIEKRYSTSEQSFIETLAVDNESDDRSSCPTRSADATSVGETATGNPNRTVEGKENTSSGINPLIGGAHSNNHSQKNNLSEISAMLRSIVSSISAKSASNLDADKVDRLLTRAEKLLKLMTSIAKVEKAQASTYTRETMKYDLIRILSVVKDFIPEPARRRDLAIRLSNLFLAPAEPTTIIRKD